MRAFGKLFNQSEIENHASEEMENQMLKYLLNACELNISKYKGQSHDNAINIFKIKVRPLRALAIQEG